ncbi:MAG: c-type cytochrome [Bdellovibrionales bacterium]|nr:c-type cytochrome [Bdellovibrionales bacterium]
MIRSVYFLVFLPLVFVFSVSGVVGCRDGHQPFAPQQQETGNTGQNVASFETVKPIFQQYCVDCHVKVGQRDWSDPKIALQGKSDGAIFDRIWTKFESGHPQRMPQVNSAEESQMSREEREKIVAWLNANESTVAGSDPAPSSDNPPVVPPSGKDPIQELSMYDKMATSCFGCHGKEGVGGIDVAPHIGGQDKQYIIQQLNAFRSFKLGRVASGRHSPYMNGAAMDLSDEEIEFFADYYSKLNMEKVFVENEINQRFTNEEVQLIEKGRQFAALGNCMGCHVDNRALNAGPGTPRLAGQKASVIIKELKDFKTGYRHSPLMNSMLTVAIANQSQYESGGPDVKEQMDESGVFRFSDDHLEALGHYFSSLVPGVPLEMQSHLSAQP